MRNITIGDLNIELDLCNEQGELRVKDLRKIQPIVSNIKDGEELEMIFKVIELFATDKSITDKIDNLGVSHIEELSEEISKIITEKIDKKK